MTPFEFHRAGDVATALRFSYTPNVLYLGCGTNLVDLMR